MTSITIDLEVQSRIGGIPAWDSFCVREPGIGIYIEQSKYFMSPFQTSRAGSPPESAGFGALRMGFDGRDYECRDQAWTVSISKKEPGRTRAARSEQHQGRRLRCLGQVTPEVKAGGCKVGLIINDGDAVETVVQPEIGHRNRIDLSAIRQACLTGAVWAAGKIHDLLTIDPNRKSVIQPGKSQSRRRNMRHEHR